MCFLKIISTTVHPFATTFKVFLTGSSFISCFRVVHDSYEEFVWSNGPIAIYWCLKNLLVVSRRVLHSSLLCITQQIVVTFCESFKLRAPHALKGCGGGGQTALPSGVSEKQKKILFVWILLLELCYLSKIFNHSEFYEKLSVFSWNAAQSVLGKRNRHIIQEEDVQPSQSCLLFIKHVLHNLEMIWFCWFCFLTSPIVLPWYSSKENFCRK